MKTLRAALAGLLSLLAVTSAQAQSAPANLAFHTVYGYLGGKPGDVGPGQAIPFATLMAQINGAQSANMVYAGPASGLATFPAFRALVGADLPATTSSTQGALPAWPNNTTTYLRGDGTYAVPSVGSVTGVLPPANGGTGVNNSSASANDVLAWNGSGFIHSVLTSVINAACTVAPTPCAYLFGHFAPEWFGAVCSPKGTAVGSIADSASAIQAAITQAAALGGATIQFGPCAYKTVNTINIANNAIFLKGYGRNQTQIVFAPPSPAPTFYFSAGTSILSNVGISDLSILSADTTTTKIAISLADVSQPRVRNIVIAHYPIDGTLFRGGSGSIGIQTQGRELGKIENMEIYAEQPIQISVNPNSGNTGEDMDSWVWRDLLLVGQLSSATRHVILADAGVAFYNTHFEGHQNWIGGVDGFHWAGGTVISEGLYFSGIKDEQAGATGGYTFNIQTPSGSLYNLHISDTAPAVRNAIFLRNVSNTLLTGVMYDPNTSTTKIGMNADISNSIIDFRACAWITGTTATLGAFTAGGANITPTGFSAALPASGTLSH
jgi:hypothetical protein